jgi:hypothetical protein
VAVVTVQIRVVLVRYPRAAAVTAELPVAVVQTSALSAHG